MHEGGVNRDVGGESGRGPWRFSAEGQLSEKPVSLGRQAHLDVGDRAVALIDILGFKERVRTSDLGLLARTLEELLVKSLSLAVVHAEGIERDAVVEVDWTKRKCGHFQFSDTILLYSFDSSLDSCVNLIVSSWHLLRSLFAGTFPCRGAICFGPLALDVENSLFVGQSIIEAYELSQAQNWCGAIIGTSVEEAHPELSSLAKNPRTLLSALVYPYGAPFKTGAAALTDTQRDYLCLNWRFNLYVQAGTKSLFGDPKDESSRVKVQNTLEFCRVLRERDRVWADAPNLPRALWPMIVGGRPDVPHGDEY